MAHSKHMKKGPYWIGFDLGGTKMMASLITNDFEILNSERRTTKGNEGFDKGLEKIVDTIHEVLKAEKVDVKELGGIGMACPGVVNLHTGVLRNAPNLGWTEAPIGAALEATFGVPVVILNDVDAGAYGEYAHGAGKDAGTLLAVFPGTGIGAGCVINGTLLTGRNASCMEIGNTRILSAGLNVPCGEPPILESLVSRLGIASAAAGEAFRGNAPNLLKAAGTDIQNIRSGTLAKAIEAGDKSIEQIIQNAAYYLGVSIAGAVDLLGPDVLVLGGGLVEKLSGYFTKSVRDCIDRYSNPALAKEVVVKEAKLGDDAVVIGAAAYGMKKAHGHPK